MIIVQESTLKLSPGPGWQWNGWDGVVKLDLATRTISAVGNKAVLAPDIVAAIAQQGGGKSYTATGFADILGVAGVVAATVDTGTLAQTVQIQSMKAVIDTTEGTFVMTVASPSAMIPPSGPPMPDTVLVKTGTWKIDQSQQRQVTAK
jgi:hypothetical protein